MLLFRSRKQPHKAVIRVPSIGPLTPLSHALIGMALAGAGYHLVVHALGLPQFRAPLRIALVVAGIFIVCTIFADGMDLVGDEEGDGEQPEEPSGFAEPEKWDERG